MRSSPPGRRLSPSTRSRRISARSCACRGWLALQRRLEEAIEEHGIGTIVVLMPHVWTPLLSRSRLRGVRYVVVVHDAAAHPGDVTGLVNRWLLRDAARADLVVTLSAHVARQLTERGFAAERIRILFHPVLGQSETGSKADGEVPSKEVPSFLFFGRIMAYKGLPLFVEACEILRREGLRFSIAVIGEGDLGPLRPRLEALAAEIDNRWIGHDEVAGIMAQVRRGRAARTSRRASRAWLPQPWAMACR